ncbi:MAG: hypothetical protein M3512_16805 [Bacteroidota bacterium]|nr:hypothetical protein [Bacteroidota bacterium]
MQSIEMHEFFLSFKVDGALQTGLFSGISLRHAKDKLLFKHAEATDIMDWTMESAEELENYINRQNAKMQILESRFKIAK